MSAHKIAVAEIEAFLASFSADSLFAHKKAEEKYKAAYKHFHAALIWNLLVEKGSFPEAKFFHYLKEAVSDLSQSYALAAMCLYKPARVMARSCLENLIRATVADKSGNHGIKSVYNLFDEAKGLRAGEAAFLGKLKAGKALYGELCLTVHSAQADHLALRIPFEQVFSFEEEQFLMTINLLHRTAVIFNHVMFIIWAPKLQELDHKAKDYVLDALPKSLKRQVADAH